MPFSQIHPYQECARLGPSGAFSSVCDMLANGLTFSSVCDMLAHGLTSSEALK